MRNERPAIDFDTLAQIETAIAEAAARIQRQQQMITEFHAKGYDVRAPVTLLSCMVANLRSLEDRRRSTLDSQAVVAL